jgi:hypothetical protein
LAAIYAAASPVIPPPIIVSFSIMPPPLTPKGGLKNY